MDLPKLDHLTKAVRLQRKDDELPVNLINRTNIPKMPIEYQQAFCRLTLVWVILAGL